MAWANRCNRLSHHTDNEKRRTRRGTAAAISSSVSLMVLGWQTPALAQGADATPAADDPMIVVTARKRQESILKVPVVVTAVSGETLENFQVNDLTDLPKLVPGLVIGGNLLSIGPQVTIRGVGTSSSDPGVDQNVSLNIDGLSLSQGLAFGSGMFDVAQVEVLKGPQALFYGKGSPGGVIALRTADPTDELEVIARAGYEFEGRIWRGELIYSTPLSETVGLRLAGTYSEGDGYFKNRAVPIESTGAAAPFERETQPRNLIARATLLWEPSDDVSVRLKANHSLDRNVNAESAQLANCPDGPGQAFGFGSGLPGSPIPAAPNFLTPIDPIPFIGGDSCKLDRDIHNVYMNPAFFPGNPGYAGLPNNGVPFLRNIQNYGTLEINYDITSEISFNSTTAFYKLRSRSLVNTSHTTAAGPTFAVTNNFSRREFTEELRLNSDFSGPLNFTLGAFYQDGRLYDRVRFVRNIAYGFLSPAVVGADILNDDRATTVDIETYSLFGQIRYRIAETLELSGGVRWTDETRSQTVFDFKNNIDLTPLLPVTSINANNFSPEATINYTPTDDLTIFASYKKAFKSGSFKVAVPAVAGEDNSFDDEQVQGYETGVKSRLFYRSLIANLAFYDYYYKGLQVGAIEDAVGGVPVIRTINAGKARTYGVDLELAYRPPRLEGLSVNASVNWNKARYTELGNIPCYSGQTVGQGCNNFFSPFPAVAARPGGFSQANPGPGAVQVNGLQGYYTAQNLSGTPMIRAPEWAVNFGFDWEMPVGNGMRLQIANNNQFSDDYVTFLAVGRPGNDNYQSSFIKIDASIALKGPEDRWEVALIGKNITDKLTASNCSATNFAGGLALGGAITGGSTSGPAGFAEKGCYTDMGRSVWVRLTLRP
jgi:iron complex outermembrane recepter protein